MLAYFSQAEQAQVALRAMASYTTRPNAYQKLGTLVKNITTTPKTQ